MSYGVILLKLLPAQYESDFLDGNLYLNTNAYFGSIDQSDIVRFDPHDGIDDSIHVKSVKIQDTNGTWLPLPISGPMSFRNHGSEKLNVLCIFTVTDRSGESFDERNLAFGDRAVVIRDIKEFIRRVKEAAKPLERLVRHGPIEYVDRETHSGSMGPFRKFSTLAYQNEFRFVFTNGSGHPCRLPIGDIRDIAHCIDAEHVGKLSEAMRNLQHRMPNSNVKPQES